MDGYDVVEFLNFNVDHYKDLELFSYSESEGICSIECGFSMFYHNVRLIFKFDSNKSKFIGQLKMKLTYNNEYLEFGDKDSDNFVDIMQELSRAQVLFETTDYFFTNDITVKLC